MKLAARTAFGLLFAGQLLVAATAQAADTEADRLFEQGRAAVRAGDLGKALERFEQSQRLDPAVGTLLNIADCEEKLGKLASAWTHLRQAIDQMKADDDRLGPIKKRIVALEPRLPRLTIALAQGTPSFTKVTRDDVELAGPQLGTEQPVDPGKHQVTVAAPGHRRRVFRVELKVAEHKSLTVEPGDEEAAPVVVAVPPAAAPAVSAAQPVPEAPAPAPAAEAPRDNLAPSASPAPPSDHDSVGRSSTSASPLGYWIGGAGAVSLAVGLGAGAMVFSKKSTQNDHCDAAKVCDQEGLDAASSARTFATVSTVASVVGLAGIGVGAYLLLTRSEPGQPQATLHVAPVAGGAAIAFTRGF